MNLKNATLTAIICLIIDIAFQFINFIQLLSTGLTLIHNLSNVLRILGSGLITPAGLLIFFLVLYKKQQEKENGNE